LRFAANFVSMLGSRFRSVVGIVGDCVGSGSLRGWKRLAPDGLGVKVWGFLGITTQYLVEGNHIRFLIAYHSTGSPIQTMCASIAVEKM
jgi:hypothetical protein